MRTGKQRTFLGTLNQLGSNDGLKILAPSDSKLVGVAVHTLVTTACTLAADWTLASAWHWAQGAAACLLVLLAALGAATSPKQVAWRTIAWMLLLALCLPLDLVWHWRHAAAHGQLVVGLTAAHWGAMLLFAHPCVSVLLFLLSLLGVFCNLCWLAGPSLSAQQGWFLLVAAGPAFASTFHYSRKLKQCICVHERKSNSSCTPTQEAVAGPLSGHSCLDPDAAFGNPAAMVELERILKDNIKKHAAQNGNRYLHWISEELADMEERLQQGLGPIQGQCAGASNGVQPRTAFALSKLWTGKYWSAYLNDRSTVAPDALMRPTRSTLQALFARVATALNLPQNPTPYLLRLSIAETPPEDGGKMPMGEGVQKPLALSSPLVGDCDQLVALLTAAIRYTTSRYPSWKPMEETAAEMPVAALSCCLVRMQYNTLFAKNHLTIEQKTHLAVAILVGGGDVDAAHLPPWKPRYIDTEDIEAEEEESFEMQDAFKLKIKTIVRSHYGHVQFRVAAPGPSHVGRKRRKKPVGRKKDRGSILLVLPMDVRNIQQAVARHLPKTAPTTLLDCRQTDELCTQCRRLANNGIFIRTTELEFALQLLRNNYGTNVHESGASRYGRAATVALAIARNLYLHADIFEPREFGMLYNPNAAVYTALICAALLYDLPQHTAVSRLFLRAHCDPATYAFVRTIASMPGIQPANGWQSFEVGEEDRTSYVRKELVALYVKLVERWHDLNHARGYADRAVPKALAEETLLVGTSLAKEYFPSTNLAESLEAAACAVLAQAGHVG